MRTQQAADTAKSLAFRREGPLAIRESAKAIRATFFLYSYHYLQLFHYSLCILLVGTPQSFAYDGKTVIVAATLSDIKKAEQGKGDMDSKKLVRVPSKVSKRDRTRCMISLSFGLAISKRGRFSFFFSLDGVGCLQVNRISISNTS